MNFLLFSDLPEPESESEEEIDDIQVLPVRIFIDNEEVIIDDNNNKIFHNNYWIKEYVKHCFKVRTKCKEKIIINKTEVHIYKEDIEIKVKIKFFLKNNEELAEAEIERHVFLCGIVYLLTFQLNNQWLEQYIKKNEIMDEYEEICDQVIDKYHDFLITTKL